ncbi:MAG: hypothetical protein LBU32_10560 [Clostridiales bacterium]|nr:hypothetical protein [Clostridiales bacterium]
MGKTSNAAKQKWNASHYTQVKASVKPETAASFKAACAAAETTMASELGRFMNECARTAQKQTDPAANVRTLGDRRKAMALVCRLIAEIRDAEEEYMDNMPESLRNSTKYEMAEERLEKLTDALDAVEDIYDN